MVDLTIGAVTGNPAYGGIESFSDQALSDIDTTPQVIPAEAGIVGKPKNVVQDFANNTLILQKAGVWNVNIVIALIFTGMNAGRQFDISIYNLTKDTEVVLARVSVGRNAEGANPSASLLFDVPESAVGDSFQLRLVSPTDVFASVILNFYTYNVIRVDVPSNN